MKALFILSAVVLWSLMGGLALSQNLSLAQTWTLELPQEDPNDPNDVEGSEMGVWSIDDPNDTGGSERLIETEDPNDAGGSEHVLNTDDPNDGGRE